MKRLLLFCLTVLLGFGYLFADDDNNPVPSPFKEENPDTISTVVLSLDIKTRHTWRGELTVKALNFQPTLKYHYKNLTIGAWSAYAVNNSYAEIDLYVSMKFLKYFSISLYDYFCPNENIKFNNFFDYRNVTTPHTLDVYLSFDGTPTLPLNFLISTMVYGLDKDITGKNQYSTYLETSYTFQLKNKDKLDLFLGGTPFSNYYANHAAILNTGFKYTKFVHFFNDIQTPVYGKVVLNPYTENLFVVFGITI